MSSKIVHAAIALGACASLFTATEAFADPPPSCDAITTLQPGGQAFTGTAAPPTVYITGSSALKPIIAALAPAIFQAQSPQRPATIVYLSQGSCVGISSIAAGSPGMPVGKTASYWDPNSATTAGSPLAGSSPAIASATLKEQACTITAPATDPTATGHPIDIGASDVFADSCGYNIQNLTTVADFQGPIQSMTFTVNQGSSEHTISAEAAYITMGLHSLSPWTNFNHIFRRNSSSGTQVMISIALGLDPNSWTGLDKGSSDGVYGALTQGLSTQADFNDAIGILSSDYSVKANVRPLAYQHFGQRCAYTPDILPGDKANTREGRYAIWGPIHLLTQIDPSTGLAKNLNARDFIAYLLGTTAPPLGIDLIRLTNQLDVVPPCAMKVQRKAEMGPIQPFVPTQSCNCAYDIASGNTTSTATSCKQCTSSSDCSGTQSCNFGYCE